MKSFNKILIASFIILIGVIFITTIKPSSPAATIAPGSQLTAQIPGNNNDGLSGKYRGMKS